MYRQTNHIGSNGNVNGSAILQSAPSPSQDEIRRTIAALFAPEHVLELRALHKAKKRTDAGYFDGEHWERLIAEAIRLNSEGCAVYVTLNPVEPQLLSRYSNRVESGAQSTTTDSNIIRRRWLLIDVDPQRPKDTSATELQVEAAKQSAQDIYQHLSSAGWPNPVTADSGNGRHLLYRIDIPNDDTHRDTVKNCLESLAKLFDTETVKVDKSVFNAGRIIKLHGTVANKGDHTPTAPWRLSRLDTVPEALEVVSVELLQALAAESAKAEPPKSSYQGTRHNVHVWSESDMQGFLTRGGLEWIGGPEPHESALRWKLKNCPFNPEHINGESAVFLRPDGALGFDCKHNSCQDRHWKDLRVLVDGTRESRQKSRSSDPGVSQKSQVSQGVVEPTPLVRPMSPAAEYPVDALGPILGPAARAISEIVQVPAALAANSVLAAAALAAQPLSDVQSLGAGARPLSLFVLTVAGSGDRKSSADRVALKPVVEHVRRMLMTYNSQVAEHEIAQATRQFRRSEAKKEAAAAGSPDDYAKALEAIADEPAPRKPFVICSEPTSEGLFKSLLKGQYAQGVFSDDGGTFLGGHALTDESQLRTIAMASRLWDGSHIDRVRAKDDEHVTLYGRRVSMNLMVQPAVATRMLGSQLYRGQGFLARWLMAAPESLAGTRRHNTSLPDVHEDPRIKGYHYALSQLLAEMAIEDNEVGGLNPPCLELTPEARIALIGAYDQIEHDQRPGGVLEPVREWASKAGEHACRIAAVLTLVSNPGATHVEDEVMRHALQLTTFYLGEYERLVGVSGISQEMLQAQALLEWIQRKSFKQLTARQVMQLGPNSIRSADAAKAALRTLVEHHWLVLDTDGRHYRVIHFPAP